MSPTVPAAGSVAPAAHRSPLLVLVAVANGVAMADAVALYAAQRAEVTRVAGLSRMLAVAS